MAGCELEEVTCTDGLDNDGDGATDCDDTACALEPSCHTPCADKAIAIACGDAPGSLTSDDASWFEHGCEAGPLAGAELVLRLDAEADGLATLGLQTSQEGVVALVYQGADCGTATCVAAAGVEPFHWLVVAEAPVTAGETTWFVLDREASPWPLGVEQLSLTCAPPSQ